MKKLKLTKGKFAIVDDEDYKYLNQWKWQYSSRGYAVRQKYINGKYKEIQLHRIVNNTPDGYQTDHINQDRLDNRKLNLRNCTNQQNSFNASLRKDSFSKIRGVSFHKYAHKWRAHIGVLGKHMSLGYFLNIEDAKEARQKAERKYFGEFSTL